jgi:hypothetical protein
MLFDPLTHAEGGFRPGAEFSKRDVALMLDQRALVDGTFIQGRKRIYMVQDNKLVWNRESEAHWRHYLRIFKQRAGTRMSG